MDYQRLIENCRVWLARWSKPLPFSIHQPAAFLESKIKQIVNTRRFNTSKDAQECVDALFDMLLGQRCYRMDAIIEFLPLFQLYSEIYLVKDLARKNPENIILRTKLNKLYKAAFGRDATDAHWMMMGIDGHFCREYPVPSIRKSG